jgi:ATP/ADP translocase
MATSGSSNSNSTVLGGYNFGFYDNSTQLAGSHFKDPVLVSAIVVNGICVFSFAVLAIVAWWMKGKRERGRRVFAFLYGLLVAMFLLVSPIIHPVKHSPGTFDRL